MGSIPAAGKERFRCPNMLSLVSFAEISLNKCAVLRIRMLTGGPLCRESPPLCRLKNPTVVYMTTCRLSSCKSGVYNVHLLIILKRGCSSMYRKRKRKTLKLNIFGHEKISLSGTPISYQKLQISLFQPKKRSHVCLEVCYNLATNLSDQVDMVRLGIYLQEIGGKKIPLLSSLGMGPISVIESPAESRI